MSEDRFEAGPSSGATAALHERQGAERADCPHCATAALREREDVLAYLRRRHSNAAAIAARTPDLAEYAGDRQRQLAIVIDEIAGELHVGEVGVAALLEGDGAERTHDASSAIDDDGSEALSETDFGGAIDG